MNVGAKKSNTEVGQGPSLEYHETVWRVNVNGQSNPESWTDFLNRMNRESSWRLVQFVESTLNGNRHATLVRNA